MKLNRGSLEEQCRNAEMVNYSFKAHSIDTFSFYSLSRFITEDILPLLKNYEKLLYFLLYEMEGEERERIVDNLIKYYNELECDDDK